MKAAKQIVFPLIIKAAFGGGGRGMRVVQKASDLSSLLDEAQSEAERAFGNAAVFPGKNIFQMPSTSRCKSSVTNMAT